MVVFGWVWVCLLLRVLWVSSWIAWVGNFVVLFGVYGCRLILQVVGKFGLVLLDVCV